MANILALKGLRLPVLKKVIELRLNKKIFVFRCLIFSFVDNLKNKLLIVACFHIGFKCAIGHPEKGSGDRH